MTDRVLLLLPTTSYKTEDLLDATRALGLELVVATDRRQALEKAAPGGSLTLDFVRPERGVARIVEAHRSRPFSAVIGVDEETTVLAAMASEALGLRHNPVRAVVDAADKARARACFREAGLPVPWFRWVPRDDDPAAVAREIEYPCVIKPRGLSASRGVLRADDPAGFVESFGRVARILRAADARGETGTLLVEGYVPGMECAVEGLLDDGRLRVLAVFDKPDPLEGPTFEETLYVTPTRLPDALRNAVIQAVQRGISALGLTAGPVHAEVRMDGSVIYVLEIAPRTIGGLCARALRFARDESLESLVLRHALRRPIDSFQPGDPAAGVMMIPIPRAGTLQRVEGLDRARSVSGIVDPRLTIAVGTTLVPLPEGHRYLGFIFARGVTPDAVERALREAHGLLGFEIA